jgi:hypothetical protein
MTIDNRHLIGGSTNECIAYHLYLKLSVCPLCSCCQCWWLLYVVLAGSGSFDDLFVIMKDEVGCNLNEICFIGIL